MTREEAIKVIDGRFEIMGYCEDPRLEEALDLAIESLKQPQPHWIPCSERLPEESGMYLCTCADAGRLMVTLIKWQPKMESWNLTGARTYWKVLAWMPLPAPYQPKEDES